MPQHKPSSWPLVLMAILFAAGLGLVGWIHTLGVKLGQPLVEDDGIVQLVGLSLISLAALLSLVFTLTDASRRMSFLALTYLLTLYAVREGDLHYKVSPLAKVSQIKFYLHPDIALWLKAAMVAVLVLALVTGLWFMSRNRRHYFSALKQRQPWAVLATGWGVVFVMSQLIDQSPLNDIFLGRALEETLEAQAEIIVCMALLAFRFGPGARPLSPFAD